jgi:hypothetical protein
MARQMCANSAQLSQTEMVSKLAQAWSARVRRGKASPRGAFALDGAPLSDDDVCSPTALLPMFVWHAENLYGFAIKSSGFGATFRPEPDALLTRAVSLDRSARSASEVLLFVLEALEDARRNLPACNRTPGAVELRGLVNAFTAAIGAGVDHAHEPMPSAGARLVS